MVSIDFYIGQPIEESPYYGYHRLAEAAIKALRPGINDLESAVLSLNVLTDLFSFQINHFIKTGHKNEIGTIIV